MMTKYQTIHACLDKPAYPSKGEALRKLYKVALKREQIDVRLTPYACPFHPTHFHLGNNRTTGRQHELSPA